MAERSRSPSPSKFVFRRMPKDPNYFDPIKLSETLVKIKLGRPETYQGFFKDRTNMGTLYDEFVTTTPPDIGWKTRIIAVCGIEKHEAAQNEDGWFLSDFAAFWHLFNGLGAKQRWMHCLQIPSVLRDNGTYLHGNPFRTRKVVLNKDIYEEIQASGNPWEEFSPADLKKNVIAAIRDEFKATKKEGGHLIIILLGHGDRNFSIVVGEKELLKSTLVGLLATDKEKANATILTSACYSGGWSCDQNLRSSTLTAATRGATSHSWAYSASVNRACGSMYATALIDMLVKDAESGRRIDEVIDEAIEDRTSIQNQTYSTFCHALWEHLFEIDRRGYEHEFTFSALDDQWGLGWKERTGIPIAEYKKRWDALAEYPSNDAIYHPGDILNQDPNISQEVRDEFEVLYKKALARGIILVPTVPNSNPGETSATGGQQGVELTKRKRSVKLETPDALKNRVKKLAQQYLDSFPGDDEVPDNSGSGQVVMRILVDNHPEATKITTERLEKLLRVIKYRMNLMNMADNLIERFGLEYPDSKSCAEFDIEQIQLHDCEKWSKVFDISQVIAELSRNLILPKPYRTEQGFNFYKPSDYLALAFLESGLEMDKIREMLTKEADLMEEELKEVGWNWCKTDQELWAKRRRMFESFGRTKGNVSPDKRRSLVGVFDVAENKVTTSEAGSHQSYEDLST